MPGRCVLLVLACVVTVAFGQTTIASRACYHADFDQFSKGTLFGPQFSALGLTFNSANTKNTAGGFTNPVLPLMIFSSSTPTGGDTDLGTPNSFCPGGGPGIGSGGRPGRPGENCEALGNLVIISEDRNANNPDDNEKGGDIVLTFARPAQINGGLDLLDIEESGGTITVTEFGGAQRVYPIPTVGNNGRAHVTIEEINIQTVVIRLAGSGGLAPFDWCIEEENQEIPRCLLVDFDSLAQGTVVTNQFTPNGVTFSSANTRKPNGQLTNPVLPLVIFDTKHVTGGDTDLAQNSSLNHLLIIQETPGSPPDDNEKGGDIIIDFSSPASIPTGLTLVDLDEAGSSIHIFNFDGTDTLINLAAGPDGNVRTVPIDSDNIMRIVIHLAGSGGLAPFEVCLDDEPLIRCAEADFDSLPAGTIVTDQFPGIHFSSAKTLGQNGQVTNPLLPLVIFDTKHVTGGDTDLAQDPSLNHLLIIQEHPSGEPDDNEKGGDIVIDFDFPATIPDGITLVDIDEAGSYIRILRFDSTSEDIPLAAGADGNVRNVPISGDNIQRITIHLAGSGGVAPFQVCFPEEPLIRCVEADFDSLAAGTTVSDQFFGIHFASANTPSTTGQITNPPRPLYIFDAKNPTGGDTDLAQNPSVNHLLIIQENVGSEPDDNQRGGDIIITFDYPASIPDGLTLIDFDESGSYIRVLNADSTTYTIPIPKGADGSTQHFDIAGDSIQQITLHLAGSGGLVPFRACLNQPEEPVIRCENADFDTLQAGTVVSTQFFGMTFSSAHTKDSANQDTNPPLPLVVFDAKNPTGGDTDLAQDPSIDHLLIIQETPNSAPDDNEKGGDIIVDFDFPAAIPQGLTVVDIDEQGAFVHVLNWDGTTLDVPLVKGADGNVQNVNIPGQSIRQLTIHLSGSGGIAPFQVCYDTTEQPVPRCFSADFDSLATGTIVDNQFVLQGLTFTSANTPLKSKVLSVPPRPLMIFDSASPTGDDFDLGTPNTACPGGGPGIGVGGGPNKPYPNCDALGHLLIISEDLNSGNPDDNQEGGDVIATFAVPSAIPNGITLLDVEESGVKLTITLSDSSSQVINVPKSGDNGKVHLDVPWSNIIQLRLHAAGSAALDDFDYCFEQQTA